MYKFGEIKECIKCGVSNRCFLRTYNVNKVMDGTTIIMNEYLRVKCLCDYEWDEECKDARNVNN